MKCTTCLFCLTLLFTCTHRSLAAEPAAPDTWKPAFISNFSSDRPIDADFNLIWGDAKVVDGKVVIQHEARRGRLNAFVDNYQFPKSVRVELIASITTDKKPTDLSLGVMLNSDGYEQPPTGYLVQVGAKGNTSALLKKGNDIVNSTVTSGVSIVSGQSYHIIAENDGGQISLWIDGKTIFTYMDQTPISDPANTWVGLFAPRCTLTIEKLVISTHGGADDVIEQPTKIPDGPQVTLRGLAMCSRSSSATETSGDHLVQFYAYDGTDQVKATMDALMDKDFAESMDVEAAQHFQKVMDEQARYFLAPCHLSRMNHDAVHYAGQQWAVTGVVYEAGGRKWIWPTKIEESKFQFPAKMLLPDKPLVMPKGDPITLNVADNLPLKCMPIPAGRFMQGSPFYVTRWQDEFAHEVVLTKPYYLAEHPITQEMFDAVMGSENDPSKRKNPKAPVENVPYDNVAKFCKILSDKNGKVVRLATDAEWEYAARVGTSNPCLTEKYKAQNSYGGVKKETVPVMSMAPNAWGLYDMVGEGWEADNDWAANDVRVKMIDPTGPGEHDPVTRDYGKGPVRKSKGGEYYEDYRPSMHGAWNIDGSGAEGVTTFRVLVEADAPAKPGN